MKKRVSIMTVVFLSLAGHTQTIIPYPIPCVEVSPSNVDSLPSGVQATDCIEADGATVSFKEDQNYSIRAGEYIELNPNTVITPDESHSFHAYIDNGGMDLAWYEPNISPGTVGRYDKLELGVQLNDSINQKIERFINRETGEKLNPFNPEDVDLYAEFWVEFDGAWHGPKRVNGFYYQEFERNGSLTGYDTISTDHNFRVRFSPSVTGLWRCQVKAVVDGYDTLNAYEFTFNCIPSDKSGFMRVGDHNRYFRRGSDPFFPVGHNLYGPEHDSSSQSMSSVGEFANYYTTIRELNENGGNYFRHIMCPWNTDIEFEALGNYSGRMSNAWEMDNIIDTATALDMVMHLDLSIHYTFQSPTEYYQHRFWDWAQYGDSTITGYDSGCYSPSDSGYCYRRELDIENPAEFFTHEEAIRYYKRKIRYMMARWSYSPAVGVVELGSEINHTAKLNDIDWVPGVSCSVDKDSSFIPYDDDPYSFPEKIYDWHTILLSYIKDSLELTEQLLCVNYAGFPDKDRGDHSFNLHDNDIVNYNEYRIEVSKYEDSYNVVEGKYHSDTSDLYVDKPLMHSEYGMGEEEIYTCDQNSSFIKRAILTPFTGMASTALTWDHPENEFDNWHYLQGIADFIGDVPLDADHYQVQKPIVTDDNAVEVFYLRNFDEDGYRAIGVVSNRTYNFFTQRVNDTCNCANNSRQEFEETGGPILLTPQIFIGADYEEAMLLPDMGVLKHYNIQWYNVLTNTLVFTEGRWSNASGELPLEFPSLTGNSTQPLVYFRVFPWSDPGFLAPDHPDQLATNDLQIDLLEQPDTNLFDAETTNWAEVSPPIQIAPNPTQNLINITVLHQDLTGNNWVLRDELGQNVRTGTVPSPNFQIDLSVLESGIYFLTFENIHHVYKIIKH